MNMDKSAYGKYVKARAPHSTITKDCFFAFVIGGGICMIGEMLRYLYGDVMQLSAGDAGTLTAVTLVCAAVLLTTLGWFDRIARFAGAGTLVPITGFANAVASPAIDSRSEGLVLGVGTKIFSVAGPVLLYGTLAGAIYGVIYYFTLIF